MSPLPFSMVGAEGAVLLFVGRFKGLVGMAVRFIRLDGRFKGLVGMAVRFKGLGGRFKGLVLFSHFSRNRLLGMLAL